MSELVKKLVKGKIGFHDVQKFTSPGEAVEVRRKAVEQLTKKAGAYGEILHRPWNSYEQEY